MYRHICICIYDCLWVALGAAMMTTSYSSFSSGHAPSLLILETRQSDIENSRVYRPASSSSRVRTFLMRTKINARDYSDPSMNGYNSIRWHWPSILNNYLPWMQLFLLVKALPTLPLLDNFRLPPTTNFHAFLPSPPSPQKHEYHLASKVKMLQLSEHKLFQPEKNLRLQLKWDIAN